MKSRKKKRVSLRLPEVQEVFTPNRLCKRRFYRFRFARVIGLESLSLNAQHGTHLKEDKALS